MGDELLLPEGLDRASALLPRALFLPNGGLPLNAAAKRAAALRSAALWSSSSCEKWPGPNELDVPGLHIYTYIVKYLSTGHLQYYSESETASCAELVHCSLSQLAHATVDAAVCAPSCRQGRIEGDRGWGGEGVGGREMERGDVGE